MAVERVQEGEAPSAVIASYGFCRTTIYKWLGRVKGRGRGLRALRSRQGTGRPPKLTIKEARCGVVVSRIAQTGQSAPFDRLRPNLS